MSNVTNVTFGNGSIQFEGPIEAIPATSQTTGNVTINNPPRPGVPAHFKTSFRISVVSEEAGIDTHNVFHWDDIVAVGNDSTSYREVEDAAARRLASTLRVVADKIELEIAAYDERRLKKATS